MALYKDEALVLSKRAYGESDRILRLFTFTAGKIAAIAKGASKSRRRGFSNTLEPFNHIRVEYFDKYDRGMVRIENADIVEANNGIEKSLKRASAAGFFTEFTDRLTKEREKNVVLFSTLKEVLDGTKRRDFSYADILYYELKMLDALGYMPNFTACVYCGKGVPDEMKLHFSYERGGLLCPACRRSLPHRAYSEGTIPGLVSIAGACVAPSAGEAPPASASPASPSCEPCLVNDAWTIAGNGYAPAFEVHDTGAYRDRPAMDPKRFEREAREILEGFISFHLDVEFKSYKILRSLLW